jgi:limonene-1,2-epoxide hydrolase
VDAFRIAVENRDIDAAVALLAPDVVFRSPVVFKPYQGREAVGVILRAVVQVLEDFRYTRTFGTDVDQVLVFSARVGEREIEGSDFLHLDASGAICELTVMVRPLSGVMALAEAMKARLDAA